VERRPPRGERCGGRPWCVEEEAHGRPHPLPQASGDPSPRVRRGKHGEGRWGLALQALTGSGEVCRVGGGAGGYHPRYATAAGFSYRLCAAPAPASAASATHRDRGPGIHREGIHRHLTPGAARAVRVGLRWTMQGGRRLTPRPARPTMKSPRIPLSAPPSGSHDVSDITITRGALEASSRRGSPAPPSVDSKCSRRLPPDGGGRRGGRFRQGGNV
jgi:hypothetical protein